ncbi:hypothetical protein CEXT_814211 [Caerostris extrusa]|uniref:Uncharacterized protein n=1 Tax=Caerostris extrusa TaxID=172846 RepID=A0AAV4XKW3_CAEEX|nr:hypothetical protein CEXT_814211 [Caerostris extrusa]
MLLSWLVPNGIHTKNIRQDRNLAFVTQEAATKSSKNSGIRTLVIKSVATMGVLYLKIPFIMRLWPAGSENMIITLQHTTL